MSVCVSVELLISMSINCMCIYIYVCVCMYVCMYASTHSLPQVISASCRTDIMQTEICQCKLQPHYIHLRHKNATDVSV